MHIKHIADDSHMRINNSNDIYFHFKRQFKTSDEKTVGTLAFLSSSVFVFGWSALGNNFGGYDVIKNNCECFTNWYRYGVRESQQVRLPFLAPLRAIGM